MTYRAALVGCGRIGADINPPGVGSSRLGSHAAAYAASARVDLVAACDPDEGRRTEAQRRWNIPRVYATVDAMLEAETLDIVSVTTPAAARPALLRQLIVSGRVRALLAEKPLAGSADDAADLAERASAAGVIGAVNYVRRYAAGYRAAAAEIQSGRLGDIQSVRGIYTKGVLNNGGHMLDLLRWLFGAPASIEVTGAFEELPGDPTVSARLRYAGFDATLDGLRHAEASIFELDVIGTRGRRVFADLGHRLLAWDVEDTMARYGFRQFSPEPRTSNPGLDRALDTAVENLADVLDGAAAPFCTFEDGRAALALALAVRDRAQPRHAGLSS